MLKTYTYHELIQASKNEPLNPDYVSSRRSALEDRDWSGADSFESALSLASHGWKESKQLFNYTNKFTQTDFYTNYDVSGSMVDVDRFVSGEPENMIDFVSGVKPKQVIDVKICGGFSAGVDKSIVFKRGELLLGMIDALESNGHQVDLSIIIPSYAGGRPRRSSGKTKRYEMFTQVILKNAGYSLNRDIVAFAVCHPAFFRRIVFAVWESDKDIMKHYLSHTALGYGRMIENHTEASDIFIPAIRHGQTEKDCLTQTEQALAKYGVQYV